MRSRRRPLAHSAVVSGPPVQVTQTCSMPADGSPVARGPEDDVPRSRRRAAPTLVMAGAAARAGRFSLNSFALRAGVEQPEAEVAVGALGVVGVLQSGVVGVGDELVVAVLRRCQDQRRAPALTQGTEVVGRGQPLREEGGRVERRVGGRPLHRWRARQRQEARWCRRRGRCGAEPRRTRSSAVTSTTCLGSAGMPGWTETPSAPVAPRSPPSKPRLGLGGRLAPSLTRIGGSSTSRSSVQQAEGLRPGLSSHHGSGVCRADVVRVVDRRTVGSSEAGHRQAVERGLEDGLLVDALAAWSARPGSPAWPGASARPTGTAGSSLRLLRALAKASGDAEVEPLAVLEEVAVAVLVAGAADERGLCCGASG